MQRQPYSDIFHHCHAACLAAGDDHQQALWHIVQLLVIKAYDERSTKSLANRAVLASSADDQKRLCDQLRQLFVQACASWPELELPPFTLPDNLLITLIQLLAPHHFFDREAPADIFGLLYTCLTPLHTKRLYGQFFTNILITEALVQLLSLRPDDCLVDPTCGTGGLLLAAVCAAHRASAGAASLQLWGIERDPTLVRLCRIALTIAGTQACIGQGDYLMPSQIVSPSNALDISSIRPTVILLNPPYGSRRANRVTDARLLDRFVTGHVWRQQPDGSWYATDTLQTRTGVAPALLCIEQSIQWLEPGGTLAIILPHGLLDTKEGYPLRSMILDTCRIGAILSLPGEAFAPEVFLQTALVLLHKRSPDTSPDPDEAIFMGVVQRIGQNRRGKSLSLSQADGTTRLDEDLTALVAAYCAYRDTHRPPGNHGSIVLRSALHPATLSLNPRRYARPMQTLQACL